MLPRLPVPSAADRPPARPPLRRHCAAQCGASADVVGALVKARPVTARQRDHHGRLPLVCAAGSGAAADVLDVLASANPDGVAEIEALMKGMGVAS